MTEPKKKPTDRSDKFTWQPGDIKIIKKGGKDVEQPKPVKDKK